MYQEFADLCEKNDITPYRVAKECGFSNVTLSDWKNKGSLPRADKLVKIAQYLHTTVEYLVTGSSPAAAQAHIISDFEFQIIVEYRKLPRDGKIMFLRTINLELPEEKKERGTGIA